MVSDEPTWKINSIRKILFFWHYKFLSLPTSDFFTSLEGDDNIMSTFVLLLGIFVILISWKLYNDWASGLAGFIYGGILYWSIRLLIELIKTIFG